MNITLPDGVVITDVPEGTSKEQLLGKLQNAKHPSADALAKAMAAEQTASESSVGQLVGAGAGLSLANIGRSFKQMVFPDSGGDAKESDAALLRTTPGLVGNVAGIATTLAPLSVIPGANTIGGAAAIGGLAGTLAPAESMVERLKNAGTGMALGGGLQAVTAYPAQVYEGAKQIVKSVPKTLRAAVEPLYEGGQKNILSRTLSGAVGEDFRGNAIANLRSAQELVPGSLPTAGEAARSGGIAAIQRSAAAVDPEAYATRAAQQNEARVRALLETAGTSGQRDFYDAARRSAADQLYEQAYSAGISPSTVTPGVKGEITKLLQRPAIQDAMREARRLAANEGVSMKNPAGSVQGLDYLKRALDDQIGKASGNEQRILIGLKNRLLTTIDRLSPDYAQARVTFEQMSKPINQMDVAQRIADKSISPLTGNIRPESYARALSDDTAAAATGLRSATLAKTMTPEQLATLENIREDLARSVMARDLGRGPGSDTVQKLAMTNLMQQSGLPLGVLKTPGLGRAANWLYQGADDEMRAILAKTLLDPKATADLMSRVTPYTPMRPPPKQITDKAALLARALAFPAAASQE